MFGPTRATGQRDNKTWMYCLHHPGGKRMMRGGVDTLGSYERHQRLWGQRVAGTPERHVSS